MSVTSDVATALATRLSNITTANGYQTNVRKVFYDRMPMAMDLKSHEMPAILIYRGDLKLDRQHDYVNAYLQVNLELVHTKVLDSDMDTFVAAIGKCIFGNSPTATANSEFRFHPAVVEPHIDTVNSDFNMIDTNRIWEMVLIVHYRCKYTNL